MAGKEEGSAPAPRRLGRGIGALLSVPVKVPQGGANSTSVSRPSERSEGPLATSPTSFQASSLSRSEIPAEADAVPRGTPDGGGLILIPVASIGPNPRQPRRTFDEASIRALSESIKSAGLMQPVVVRKGTGSPGFELIAGERRWRAAKMLGMAEIPALVREVDDRTAGEWALIENIQREDLNPIDRSEALERLIQEFSLTHQDLGDRLGIDRVTITNLLRLADLDPFTKDAVRRGELSQGHAKVLLGVQQQDLRKRLASAAIAAGLSVRELERRVREMGSAPTDSKGRSALAPARKPHIEDLERKLSEHLGTKVSIQEEAKKKGSGRVVIDYYSFEQFEGLMTRMGFQSEL